MAGRKFAYNALGVLAWAIANPLAFLVALFLLYAALFVWAPAGWNWASNKLTGTARSQTYEECVLEEMRGQAANVLTFARKVCFDRTKAEAI